MAGLVDPYERYGGMTEAEIEADLIAAAGPDYKPQSGAPLDPAMFGVVAKAIHALINGGNAASGGWHKVFTQPG